MKPIGNVKEREDHIQSHTMKCFTHGKPVRRNEEQLPDDSQNRNRLDELRRKFNRISLLRKYYSKKNETKWKKFNYPIDQRGEILAETREQIRHREGYDYMQYCACSDLEDHEYVKNRKARRRRKASGSY